MRNDNEKKDNVKMITRKKYIKHTIHPSLIV